MRVVVGVHGAGDRPDWACTEWLEVMSREAFAACPHGTPDPRWAGTRVWGSGVQIARESTRALTALRAAYGAWLADEPLTYGAWSQGATLADGAVEALAKTERPDRVALVEIGHTKVDPDAMAKRFLASGSTSRCTRRSEPSSPRSTEAEGAREGSAVADVINAGWTERGAASRKARARGSRPSRPIPRKGRP